MDKIMREFIDTLKTALDAKVYLDSDGRFQIAVHDHEKDSITLVNGPHRIMVEPTKYMFFVAAVERLLSVRGWELLEGVRPCLAQGYSIDADHAHVCGLASHIGKHQCECCGKTW